MQDLRGHPVRFLGHFLFLFLLLFPDLYDCLFRVPDDLWNFVFVPVYETRHSVALPFERGALQLTPMLVVA